LRHFLWAFRDRGCDGTQFVTEREARKKKKRKEENKNKNKNEKASKTKETKNFAKNHP
tara:strand:+ start:2732 stop:2905 length:174 start_codon:yes stop_codon:yes gene_type:complete